MAKKTEECVRERKLYSLEAINSSDKTDRHIIKIKNAEGKYEKKAYLSRIDEHITTYFESLEHLLYYLKQANIIADRYDDIKITYRHSGIKSIDLVFKGNDIIKQVAKNSKTEVDLEKNSGTFNHVVNHFFKLCQDDLFFDLINKSSQIPEHLKIRANELNKFINGNTNEDANKMIEIKTSIKSMLKNYKVFRTIVLYIDCFLNDKEIQQQIMLPEINNKNIKNQTTINTYEIAYDREEKEEFLSEEELKKAYPDGNQR